MMRWLAALALAIGCCSTACHTNRLPDPAAPPKYSPTPAPLPIDIVYREPANAFEILDNVSRWWSDKVDKEYREDWEQRFGALSDADQNQFAQYKEIRKRYFNPPDPAPDPHTSLFAFTKPPDRIAQAFYAAQSIDEALETIAKFASADDVLALKKIFASYRPKLAVLLDESKAFTAIINTFTKKLEQANAAAAITRIARFYQVPLGSLPARFTVLFIWYPPIESMTANNRDQFLLLKYHPIKHREEAEKSIEIPIHEVTHYISAHQPEAQKRALTKTFLAGCDPLPKIPPAKILEEPLAVVEQKIFLEAADPERFDFSSSWYGGDPWIGTSAKLFFGIVKDAERRGKPLDESLMRRTARTCAQLKAAGEALLPPP